MVLEVWFVDGKQQCLLELVRDADFWIPSLPYYIRNSGVGGQQPFEPALPTLPSDACPVREALA